MKSTHKITNLCFYCVVIVISAFVIAYPPNNSLCYDVFGYYMYLPLAFKYNDITIQNYSTITNILNTYHASETFYQAVKWDNGSWVMRYPIGLSMLFAPFYFIADGIAKFTNYPSDGFSKPYQLSILYGGLVYSIIGLYFVKKILTQFFDDLTSAVSLFCIALGTNYFFHVGIHGQGAMSHNLLFSLYAIITYLTIKWHQTYSFKTIALLGVFIGISALCRPSEIISFLIPLFYGVFNWQSFKAKILLLLKYKSQVFGLMLVIFSVGFIQFAYWKYASDKFIINPYGAGNPGEGMELFHPHILEVLFSFRKGWFIYTPIMLFTMIGFWQLYKHNTKLFTPIFIYFIVNLYIVSSWSCWWYGACFGVRSLIPSYAVLSIPLAYFVSVALKHKLKILFVGIFIFCIALNLFQSWQMYSGIMDSTNMSRAYYFSTFLQTSSPTNEQKKTLLIGKFSDGIEQFRKEDSLTHSLNFARIINFEAEQNDVKSRYVTNKIHHSGTNCYQTDSINTDSPAMEIMVNDITSKSYTWIKASIWLYPVKNLDNNSAYFSIELKHKGWPFKPKIYYLDSSNCKAMTWTKLEYYYLVPDDLRSKKDKVSILFKNRSKQVIYIDDILLESYEPIHDKSVF
jgi:hypothetical protein